jgi:hypothetical protein
MFIQQDQVGQLIIDVFSVLSTPLSQGTIASQKYVSLLFFNEQKAFDSLLSQDSLRMTNTLYALFKNSLLKKDQTAKYLVNVASDSKYIDYLFKEYRNELLPSKRRLQEEEWSLGNWYFESQKQIVATVEGKEYRIDSSF